MAGLFCPRHIIQTEFSHDNLAAILVSQDNETATMLLSKTNPVGVELFSYVNKSLCIVHLHGWWVLATWVKS